MLISSLPSNGGVRLSQCEKSRIAGTFPLCARSPTGPKVSSMIYKLKPKEHKGIITHIVHIVFKLKRLRILHKNFRSPNGRPKESLLYVVDTACTLHWVLRYPRKFQKTWVNYVEQSFSRGNVPPVTPLKIFTIRVINTRWVRIVLIFLSLLLLLSPSPPLLSQRYSGPDRSLFFDIWLLQAPFLPPKR